MLWGLLYEGTNPIHEVFTLSGLITSVQFSSVVSDSFHPMDCSIPDLPVRRQLLEFTQTQVHHVGDAIQPSYPLLSPSPPAFNLSQHQVAKVLKFQLQHQSSQ